MPTNTRLLKGKIVENGLTDSDCADKIGISRQSFSRKINNKTDFKASEILSLCVLLGIKEKDKYFFVM